MPLDVVETLSELVAIPSVNPMGRGLTGPEFFETRMTVHLEKLFDRIGVPWERQLVEPGRDNIIARFDGDLPPEQGGQVLLWEAHQDTVPVDGMTIEPFQPLVRDGRLQGRGSCDIKGGMAAMLAAFSRIVEERPAGRPTILLACTVNEEHGYSGAVALTQLWAEGARSIFPRRPDAAVVAEPTSLQVVVAHKGALRWFCRTVGRAIHSSRPELGDNALYKMAHVLLALEAYQKNVVPTLPTHPLCGRTSLSVGTIAGGISVNTVPDDCVIAIDRRLLPGEDGRAVFEQIRQHVASFPNMPAGVVHDTPWMWGATLSNDRNGAFAERLRSLAEKVLGQCDCVGVPYGTNAAKIASSGVPSVVFGPGSIDQAHTADEWISLSELNQAVAVLERLGREGL